MAVKYIFVTGGVGSGLGKGIAAASLGRLLKQRGLKVKVQKLDPYLNVDPGTMSPYQHGEVFVTDDGAETDLDLGHYERFIDENLDRNSSVSSGQIYWEILNKERRGDFLGGTVQIIPHVTGEIKRRIYSLDVPGADVAIVEIGGTVGDIESQPFLEAIRQVAAAYGQSHIDERHRHRYEFNNDYREKLTAAGLALTGLSPDGRLVEIVELPDHPWFVGVQFHPELKSRPNKAHPLFREFIAAAKAGRK